MLGGIIGDIVGSIYEDYDIKSKDFPLFTNQNSYTDDSVLTLATAEWLMKGGAVEQYYYEFASNNRDVLGGYGTMFYRWLALANRGIFNPYNSCGNGSAMRVSPVAWAFSSEAEVLHYAQVSAECTHNHIEGIKGAKAVALAIFMARHGLGKEQIVSRISTIYGYDLSMSVDELITCYSWRGVNGEGNGAICQDSVPQAIICALEAETFEEAIRNAVAIGGDSDTIACITGSIAEALYGIPKKIYEKGFAYLPKEFQSIVTQFEDNFGRNVLVE